MRLILIRHGPTEDRDAFAQTGKGDALRPLSSEGKRRMKEAARGLRKLYPRLDLLVTSPLKRAVQTAKLIYQAHPNAGAFIELDLLAGNHLPHELIDWLKNQDLDAAIVALVGHEPHLSRCAGLFVTGQEKSLVALKKGAACVIDFPGAIAPGTGILAGLFQPRDLRKIK